jgi:hypothetical protein
MIDTMVKAEEVGAWNSLAGTTYTVDEYQQCVGASVSDALWWFNQGWKRGEDNGYTSGVTDGEYSGAGGLL